MRFACLIAAVAALAACAAEPAPQPHTQAGAPQRLEPQRNAQILNSLQLLRIRDQQQAAR